MLRPQEVTRGSRVLGIVPGQAVLVLDTRSFGGGHTLEVTYRTDTGQTESGVLYCALHRRILPSRQLIFFPGTTFLRLDGSKIRVTPVQR